MPLPEANELPAGVIESRVGMQKNTGVRLFTGYPLSALLKGLPSDMEPPELEYGVSELDTSFIQNQDCRILAFTDGIIPDLSETLQHQIKMPAATYLAWAADPDLPSEERCVQPVHIQTTLSREEFDRAWTADLPDPSDHA